MWIKQCCVILLLVQLIYFVNGQGNLCSMPNNQPGLCQVFPNCPSLYNAYLNNQRSREVIRYLVQSQKNCGNRSFQGNPIICCGDDIESMTTTTTTEAVVTFPSAELCSDPNGIRGQCLNLRNCPAIYNEFVKRQNDQAYIRYVQGSNANCNYNGQNICCPQQSQPINVVTKPPPVNKPQTDRTVQPEKKGVLLTPETGCGFSNVTINRVVGGEDAKLAAWPWMALIGYTDSVSGEVSFKCGGSLITSRHILTAAHCIRSTLTTVRLGEFDLSKDGESPNIDIPVVKVAKHPKYDKKDGHTDLAVLYLEKDVEFSYYIRPVCLPINEPFRSRDFVGYQPFVAGWGRTQEGGKSANVLQQLQLPVLENEVCMEKYKAANKLISQKQFDNAVLCAGQLAGGMDSCQGDSGGPLFVPTLINGVGFYYQIGIVSYGIGCARAEIPGVYCKVQTFVDWIQEKVAEPI